MRVKAAVAFAPDKPLEIELVDLDGPKAGEVLVEIKATGVYTPTSSRVPVPTPRGCSRRSSGTKARASWSTSVPASPR